VRKLASRSLLLLLTVVLVFIVMEGAANTLLFCWTLLFHPPGQLAERGHTRYDAELGWASIPNVSLRNYYGPGLDLTTNAQGFRGEHAIGVAVPPGMIRIICSGDSMTLGYGVGDAQTWCQTLASLDPRVEPVNMGQGGYGIDQAYLWYRRDGARLRHQLQILAFVTIDFDRMQGGSLFGYQKPVLALQNGSLVVTNTPVPRGSRIRPWLTENLSPTLQRLGTFQIASKVVQKVGLGHTDPAAGGNFERALAVFEALRKLNADEGSRLLLVYLPMQTDWDHRTHDPWRTKLAAELQRRSFWYVDLVDELRRLPFWRTWEMFIAPGAVRFVGSAGHYTVSGNAWVARSIFDHLLADSEFAKRLSALTPVQSAGDDDRSRAWTDSPTAR
jgi:hypothetical protein